MLELRTDLTKILINYRRIDSRKTNSIGMWEKCMWFQIYFSAFIVSLCISFSTNIVDHYFLHFGVDPGDTNYFVRNGEYQVHVTLQIKAAIAGALTISSIAFLQVVVAS